MCVVQMATTLSQEAPSNLPTLLQSVFHSAVRMILANGSLIKSISTSDLKCYWYSTLRFSSSPAHFFALSQHSLLYNHTSLSFSKLCSLLLSHTALPHVIFSMWYTLLFCYLTPTPCSSQFNSHSFREAIFES